MDAELIGWLVVMAFWFISSIVQQIRKMGKGPEDGHGQEPNWEEIPAPPASRPQAPPSRPALSRPQGRPSLPPPPIADSQDPFRDLLKQLGVEPQTLPSEKPVASEHQLTAGEHMQAPSELIQSSGESLITPSEHRRTASENRLTPSEHRRDPFEIRRTVSEHRPGDVKVVPRLRSAGGGTTRKGGSAVARSLRRDLRQGQTALQRAFVLKEVLGRPIGLRSPGENTL